jgi:leucyl-tRNA synthetase
LVLLEHTYELFLSSAARIALADAGDGIEDANLEESFANASILRLFELKKWSKDILDDPSLRTGELTFFDKLFDNDLNALVLETRQHYEKYVIGPASSSTCYVANLQKALCTS